MAEVRTTTASASSSSEVKVDLTLDDIAKIYVGRITDYQHQPKTRKGTTIDRSRQRELRRHLNRTAR